MDLVLDEEGKGGGLAGLMGSDGLSRTARGRNSQPF